MSGIEAIGRTLSFIVRLLVSDPGQTFQVATKERLRINNFHTSPTYLFKAKWWDFRQLCHDHGILMAIILTLYAPGVRRIMKQVEEYVLVADDVEVVDFMASYTSSFGMIAVAGAIIAQVAITALSLTRLEDSHWTVEAFYVVSLVTGALSVYFACVLSPALHGLHNANDIRDFLTVPAPRWTSQRINTLLTKVETSANHASDDVSDLRTEFSQHRWKIASAYSAMILIHPMDLLKIALSTFLIGLGIYLGRVWAIGLVPSFGLGSLFIFITFLITVVCGMGFYYIALELKKLESEPLDRITRLFPDISPKKRPEKREHGEEQDRSMNISRRSPQMQNAGEGIETQDTSRFGRAANPAIEVSGGNAQSTPQRKTGPSKTTLARADGSLGWLEELTSFDYPNMNGKMGIRTALSDLILAQERTVCASQRLLEVFDAGHELDED
ncbi:uncharacterized protein BDR25DRAFT_345946 [Lindgomyces ingoldianus]|uniref:Uncharacterized protein n=1 Tax=Lindgomyces ingoldianus TaxID=673940 RepID=A0ACB6QI05_9PLEO|nr:uncharacterized protein BDR25DRAFT_345946 [Lindgomyces ingoldianus]KAF2465770.1 hypothetical protein BDR25DRAFT_345946 [Lindgomyces ingoldianus]